MLLGVSRTAWPPLRRSSTLVHAACLLSLPFEFPDLEFCSMPDEDLHAVLNEILQELRALKQGLIGNRSEESCVDQFLACRSALKSLQEMAKATARGPSPESS